MVSQEIIEGFFSGNNPINYVVAIEGSYSEPYVYLVINDPERGKYIKREKFRPFIWFKEEVKKLLYNGDRAMMKNAADKHDIRTKKLRTSDDNGFSPDKLQNGFKYIATTTHSYNELIVFFKNAGIDIFDAKYKHLFFAFTPVEQYMIQSKVRLFKGFEDYNDLHRFQFDLETEGLTAHKHAIFAIGMKDNKGYERVLKTIGNTPQERRNSERANIIEFFDILSDIKPDIISGYNSESFDWKFIVERAERLNINLSNYAIGLDGKTPMKRKPTVLKIGGEVEPFDQTYIYGTNVIDISHAVRRAQAIDTDIKSWTLKWITKYAEIAKKNRVYVKGDRIHAIWSDTQNQYAFNDTNGDWYKISDRMPLKDSYEIVTGAFIIERYLLDDLWETQEIDTAYNQASFLIAKILPTTFCRSTTMGTATQWKLIMAAWSYENDLAIPITERKRDFTGGLSRLLAVGYSRGVVKFDYAALYPKTELTHDIFPDLDISGVMKGILAYIVDERDTFKFLMEENKDKAKKLTKELENNASAYSKEELAKLKADIKEHKALAGFYKKKQMPLKILANSWFGAYGAPYIFNWGDTNCAEETTCRGRQYLRLMVRHFTEKFNFKALVGDTDGFNFQIPDNINEFKYTAIGNHWKTTNDAGKELVGVEAALAEFNETFMTGRMGLDIDEVCNSTINFSRKNYATDVDGKIKFVGNSIKSKKMPVYIEDFLDKAIRLLLDGKGKEFINFYYEYVDKIYNYNIPLVKIASKSKVKSSIADYKVRATKKNKAGAMMSKQAHMELAMQNNLDINLGDTIFYVNIGKGKSEGDVKTIKDDKGAVTEVKINCKLIDSMVVELNLEMIKEIETLNKIIKEETSPEKIKEMKDSITEMEASLQTDEYNVAKYLEALNKKVEPLLVCFHPDIRKKILLSIKKDRKTKVEKLMDRNVFIDSECQLVSGLPDEPGDQDDYFKDLMVMEDKEIKFWHSVNKLPNNMEEAEWNTILADYHVRMVIQRENGIIADTQRFDDVIRRFDVRDLDKIVDTKIIPEALLLFVMVNEEGMFVSKKWEVVLGDLDDLFKYEVEANERNKWYQLSNTYTKDKYELWLEYKKANNLTFEEAESSVKINPTEIKVTNVIEVEPEEDEDEDEDKEEEPSDYDMLAEIQKEVNLVQMSNPTLEEIAERFKDRDMFPKKTEAAKSYLESIKILMNEKSEKDEWNF